MSELTGAENPFPDEAVEKIPELSKSLITWFI
jgi:hypothetical protein